MRTLLLAALMLPIGAAAKQQTWTIGNDHVKRVVEFDDDKGLVTSELTNPATHVNYITADRLLRQSSEFSFQCGDHLYKGRGTDFEFVSAAASKIPKGDSLTIKLRAKRLPMEVSVIYNVYDHQPAVRKHLVVRNTGKTQLRITHLDVESIAPSLGPSDEVTLNAQYGTLPRETFYTGRSEDAGLLVGNARTGIGFAILSEVPGYMKRTEIDAWYNPGYVRIEVLYDTDLLPFERSLAPDEEFTTAAVSIVLFRKGDGFQDPRWVLPTYTSQVLMRRIGHSGSPWIYNTWEPFQRTINEATTLKLIDAAAEIGFDIFTIDDGWQTDYGENTVDRKAFPGGLDNIRSALQSKHMRLGVWIPMAAIGTQTAEARNHPEWIERNEEGKQKITSTAAGAKAVMCLASPFRQVAAMTINQAITKFNLAYVKLDLTTMFNTYGEAPGCHATGHLHKTWAESLNMIYEGMAYVTRKVYEEHPDVLLDLTFELWGQKHVIDAGLLAAGDLDWLSNVKDRQEHSSGTFQARTLLYQRAASMPVDTMLIGNLQAETPSIQERFATAIGSSPLLLGDLQKLSAVERKWYGDKVAWFKDLRSRVAISESFFPLGNWKQPNATQWDGFARLAHSGSGVVAIFRNGSHATTATIELPLLPRGRFQVHSVITGKKIGVFSQADWAKGVNISLSSLSAVEILEISTGK